MSEKKMPINALDYHQNEVAKLRAELALARKVVEAAKDVASDDKNCTCDLCASLRAYTAHVGGEGERHALRAGVRREAKPKKRLCNYCGRRRPIAAMCRDDSGERVGWMCRSVNKCLDGAVHWESAAARLVSEEKS